VYWGQTDFGGLAELRTIKPLLPGQRGERTWYTERHFYDAQQAAVAIVPDTLPSHKATLVEPLTSVLRCLLFNPPKPGDVCVVLGCGPSALLAVQVMTRFLGAGPIVVVDKLANRVKIACNLGASVGFDIGTDAERLAEYARQHHDHYADYVLDTLPHVQTGDYHPDVRLLAMELLRPGGTYVIYGATVIPQKISTWHLLAKGLRVQATPFDVRAFPMSRTAYIIRTALKLIGDGAVSVEPLITSTFPFEEAAQVCDAFANYGSDDRMKTSILCNGMAASSTQRPLQVGRPTNGQIQVAG
jgi:L-iditol 2-dehydrogenase/threonine 3-dehydrogenase